MKIIKTKTYKGMKEQIDKLTKQILKQQHELRVLQDTNASLGNECDIYFEKMKERDKEIKRLKTLLTKNKIAYKKEDK